MKKYFLLCIIGLVSNTSHAAQQLSATMTFESMTITSEGVKKQTHFQERFIRDEQNIWSERIIPALVQKKETHNSAEHDHEHEHDLNFATAAKWIVRENNTPVKFRFVRIQEQKIIEPRDSEYGTLGFDGDWTTSYYLLNPASLKSMVKLETKSAKGTTWYEKKSAEQFTRILWDEEHEIPLSIESGKLDGSTNNKITVSLTSIPSSLPWKKLSNFKTIAYEDLLD